MIAKWFLFGRCGPFPAALQALQEESIKRLLKNMVTAVYPITHGLEAFNRAKAKGTLKVLLDMQVNTWMARCNYSGCSLELQGSIYTVSWKTSGHDPYSNAFCLFVLTTAYCLSNNKWNIHEMSNTCFAWRINSVTCCPQYSWCQWLMSDYIFILLPAGMARLIARQLSYKFLSSQGMKFWICRYHHTAQYNPGMWMVSASTSRI